MSRHAIISMLDAYEALFPDEGAVVDRVRQLVAANADCFHRTCRPGHITASAWILSPDRRRVLLTHHRKLDKWLQVGGHADGQWDPIEVALREAVEESGLVHLRVVRIEGQLLPLDIDVHEIPPFRDAFSNIVEDAHYHHDIRFLFLAEAETPPRASEESHDVRWFTPAELLQVTTEESVLRMLHKAARWMM
jgi:8-oxo-dGTP pyrophosphatase MutT (NUDIX family)